MTHKYLPGIASEKCQFPVSSKQHCLCPAVEHDALIEATIDLEVAVDDYTQASYDHRVRGVWPKGEDHGFLLRRKIAIVDAAVEVALAMADADVDGSEAAAQIPSTAREEAANAEIDAFRRTRMHRELMVAR